MPSIEGKQKVTHFMACLWSVVGMHSYKLVLTDPGSVGISRMTEDSELQK